MSGFWLFREKYSDHWCVQKINTERICKISKAYFIIVTIDQGEKTDKIWLCESVGKLTGVGQQAKAKMNELSINTIADLQLHVRHHSKVPIWGFNRIYAMALQDIMGNPPSSFKEHKKAKNPYHSRYREIWVDKLKSFTAMSKFCCITDLIRFMMNEA